MYWPYYALKQDSEKALAEAAATATVCVQQSGLTQADCSQDRSYYQARLLKNTAPPDRSAIQNFAGNSFSEIAAMMATLIGLPLMIVYIALRALLAAVLWLLKRLNWLLHPLTYSELNKPISN